MDTGGREGIGAPGGGGGGGGGGGRGVIGTQGAVTSSTPVAGPQGAGRQRGLPAQPQLLASAAAVASCPFCPWRPSALICGEQPSLQLAPAHAKFKCWIPLESWSSIDTLPGRSSYEQTGADLTPDSKSSWPLHTKPVL